MRKFFLILLLLLALAPVLAHAGTYVLPASRDAWLDEGNPMNNFGADPELRQRDHPATGDNRSLIHFDLSGIPAGEAVVFAYVRLYVTNADESGLPVTVYRVTNNWTEADVNWNNSGNDYDGGTIHGSFSLPAVGLYAVDATSLVRLWVDGIFANHGMMLIATSDDIESKFASREWPTPGQTPTLYIVTGDTSMRLATGTYTGNGTDNTPITGVGFRPDVVIVKGDADEPSIVKTSTMIGNISKQLGTALAPDTDGILSLDADGFTVSSRAQVNGSGTDFYWVAFRSAPDDMAVGSYVGNGQSSQDITGLNFQPGYVIVMSEAPEQAVQRFPTQTGVNSRQFDATGETFGQIESFFADGFRVGSSATVNMDLTSYHYLAWPIKTGIAYGDSYTGNQTDNRNINGLGFQPEYVITSLTGSGYEPVHRMASTVGDASSRVNGGTLFTNGIQAFLADGFQLGDHFGVNGDGTPHFYIAFNDPIPGADLSLKMALDDTLKNVADTVSVYLTLENVGPDDATGIQVTDLLPAGLTYVTHVATQGTYDFITGIWNVGTLLNTDMAGLAITAVVDPGTAGSMLTNIAAVTAVDQVDPNPSDNSATASVYIQGVDLALTKTVNDPTPIESDAITFTVEISNAGPDDATGVEVTDFVPAGLTYGGHTVSQGNYDDVTGVWDIGTVAVTGIATLTIDATVDIGSAGWTISNLAAVTAVDQADPNIVDNSAFAKVTVQSSAFRTATGSYTGTGSGTRSITGVGFRPDMVIVQGEDGEAPSVKSASMPGTLSKELARSEPMFINVITSLDADGFTVSPDAWMNFAGNQYYWIAFKTAPGNLVVGSYDGDGSDNRAVTGLGFTPGYTMVLPEWDNQATQRFPGHTGDASIRFGASDVGTNWIQAFLPDGFEVGSDSLVNAPGMTYHYVAWNGVAGITTGGLHTGNGIDGWDINGLGFQPDYVLVKQRASSNGTVHRPSSIIGDNTLSMRQGLLFSNGIQALLPDGFEVGTGTSVNQFGSQYDWFAFRDPSLPVADLELTMAVSDSVPVEGDTLNYTITLVNNGPDGASGVQVIDLLPAGVTYLSDAPSQGTYTSAAGLWDVGAILASDSATLYVLAAVDLGTVDQTIGNSATIASANQADPDTTDNSATASITVGPSEMRVASGSYTGDGADDRAIAGIGFEPDVVIVKGDLSESALIRTSTMNGDVSRALGEKSALLSDLIQSLDPDGFTVGTSDGVNKSAVTYYWTAFRAAKPEMVVGSYPGNGVDDRSIAGLRFEPTYVIVLNEAAEDAMQRFAPQFGDASLPFNASDPKPDRIQAFEPDGFQVGKHGTTNRNGDVYHFIAWNGVAGRVKSGMYVGDDTDNRDIGATSFKPDFLLLQRSENGSAGLFRNSPVTGDLSLPVDRQAGFNDRIQALLPDGFQVGGHDDVNKNSNTYYWTAFKDSRMLDVAVTKGVDNPAPNAGDRVEFTITVMNNGPVDATGVQVRDVLPAGLTYDSDAPSVGTYDPVTGVWDVGPLSNGVATALLLRAGVDTDAGGSTIVNTASLWSVDQIDVAAANNTGTASVTVTSADLEISASVDNAYPAEGDTITYLIRLANRGPDDATAVTVTDSLPLGVAYVADSTSAGTYDTTTGVWNVGNLPGGSADTLLIYARIDAGTMGSYITNAAYITGSAVADPDSSNDADSATVLVPTPVALDDTPGSLFPASAFVGDPDLAIRIGVDNAWNVGVTLDTMSTISFTDGTHNYQARLANPTLVPPSANDFTLSFVRSALPAAFVADSTYDVTLALTGVTGESLPFSQVSSTTGTNAIYVDQPKMSVEAPIIGDVTVNPGQLDAALLVLEFDNHYSSVRTLDSLLVTNFPFGPGSRAQLDGLTGPARIYDDVDGSLSLTAPDSLLSSSIFSGGGAVFAINAGWTIPALTVRSLVVTADVDSMAARDGDALDAKVPLARDIVFVEPTVFADVISPLYPLDSYGVANIDGMVAHQIAVQSPPIDTLYSGDVDALVLEIVLPQNGYEPDTLVSLNIKDYSGSFDPAVFDRVNVYRDDGDGAFDPAGDANLGEMVFSGDRYEITGLSVPVGPNETYFVTADISFDPTNGNTFRPGVPEDGVNVNSNNDGPIDVAVASSKTLTIVKVEKIDVTALPLAVTTPHPGNADVSLLHLEIKNNTLQTVVLDSLRLENATVGPGNQAELDGDIAGLSVLTDDGNGVVDAWDVRLAQGLTFSTGALVAGGLAQSLDPGKSVQLLITCDVDSFCARDSDALGVRVANEEDFDFDTAFQVSGAFPVETAIALSIDGMMSFQIGVHPSSDSLLILGTTDIPVLELTIPANGYAVDTLISLQVNNFGSADEEHIQTINLWADGGDGTFDGGALDDLWLNSLVSLGAGEYQRSGLSLPLIATCPGGTRIFVSCDLTTDYDIGANFRFGVPVGGIGVASGNDGPIDVPVLDPRSRLLPAPDELLVFSYPVGDKRVYAGTQNELNFGIVLYNGFSTPITLTAIELQPEGSADHAVIDSATAFADADNNELFDPFVDLPIARTAPTEFGSVILSGFKLDLQPEAITYLFVAYDMIPNSGDSILVDLKLTSPKELTLEPTVPDNKIIGLPVNSPGMDFTDGMIAAQIALHDTPAAVAAPGDQHVLSMGLTIPANGPMPDELTYLTILNAGSAVAGQDIDELDLWEGDRLISTLNWTGSGWRNPTALSEPIPVQGLTVDVTFSAAVTANDDRTFQAVLPLGGVEVLSGNDGPIDIAMANPNAQTISTDPLITTVSTDRASYSTTQEIVLSMRVRNEDTDSLLAITAPAPTLAGTGAATYLDGPTPATVDLAAGEDTTMVWRYAAASAGDLQFCAHAHDADSSEVSIHSCTPVVVIQDKPVEIALTITDAMPIAVNRGQGNVEAVALELKYNNYGAQSAPVSFEGIEITVENGAGVPIPPNTVLGEITIVSSSGTNQPFSLADSTLNPLRLYLSDAIEIEPGDSLALDVNMDIAAGAAFSPFRLSILSPTAVGLVDANDEISVPLTTGASFPWSTHLVDVEAPAESLLVSTNPAGSFYVNNGQDHVEIFRFALLNNGPAETANIILKSVTLSFQDTTGAPIVPTDVIRNLALTSSGSGLFFDDAIPSSGTEIVCDLANELLLPPQTAHEVVVTADLRAFPGHDGFFVSIDNPSAVIARDNNDGRFVIIAASAPQMFPLKSPEVLFQQAASGLMTNHSSLVPRDILPSTYSVPLLDVAYTHEDSSASSIVVDSLAMAFVDKSGNPLFPGNYFSELCVISTGDTLALITSLSSVSHVVEARLNPPVTMGSLSTNTFHLYLSSKGVYVPKVFQVRIDREHVIAYDANTGERILSINGDFPFFSDPSRLQLPGDAVDVGVLSRLPANVTGRETSIPAFDFVVRNDNPTGYTSSELRGLTVEMQNFKRSALNPQSYLSGASIVLGDSVIATATVGTSNITFDMPAGLIVTEPGSADTLTFTVDLAATGTETFRFVIADTTNVDVRDATTGGAIAAGTVNDTGYPLSTALTHLLGAGGGTAFTNYPNPFAAGRQTTRVTFFLDESSRVTLRLYTLWGAPVKTLINGETRSAGLHQNIEWSGRTGDGDVVNNGVYYLVLDVEPTSGGSAKTYKRKVGVVR